MNEATTQCLSETASFSISTLVEFCTLFPLKNMRPLCDLAVVDYGVSSSALHWSLMSFMSPSLEQRPWKGSFTGKPRRNCSVSQARSSCCWACLRWGITFPCIWALQMISKLSLLLLLLHCNSQIMVPIDEMEMILMLKRFHPLACRQEVGNESKSCRDVMNHFLGFCCITAID